jgi:hypothetical protein
MKNNLEELRRSLPDYIQDKINDVNEIESIEKEIKINPDFKKEYEDMKDSIYFLKLAKFQEPPDNYFNTILPRLNDKINGRITSKQNIFSFLKLKRYYWNYLVPVIPILFIFLIYSVYFNNHSDSDNSIYISNDSKTDFKNKDSVLNKVETEDYLKTQSTEVEDTVNETKSASDVNNAKLNNYSYNDNRIDNADNIDNNDNIDAETMETTEVFSKEEDDISNLQSQFNQLDDDTQNDILDNLKNEKL